MPEALEHKRRAKPIEHDVKLYDISKAAEKVGVCKSTLRNEIRAGRLHALRIGASKRYWFTDEVLDRWIREELTDAAEVFCNG